MACRLRGGTILDDLADLTLISGLDTERTSNLHLVGKQTWMRVCVCVCGHRCRYVRDTESEWATYTGSPEVQKTEKQNTCTPMQHQNNTHGI